VGRAVATGPLPPHPASRTGYQERSFLPGRMFTGPGRVWAWHQTIADPDHLAAAPAAAP